MLIVALALTVQSEHKSSRCRMRRSCDFLQTPQQTGSGLEACVLLASSEAQHTETLGWRVEILVALIQSQCETSVECFQCLLWWKIKQTRADVWAVTRAWVFLQTGYSELQLCYHCVYTHNIHWYEPRLRKAAAAVDCCFSSATKQPESGKTGSDTVW